MAHILILGGGFGGLAAADELRGRLGEEHRITVVDRRAEFFMGFAKLWDLAGLRPIEEGTRPLARLDDRGVAHVRADITAIDPAGCRVETTAGTLEGDALLVALGTHASDRHREMLSGPGAHDLYDREALAGIHADLDAIERGLVAVSILGGPHRCPPAPFEAALIVDQRLREQGVREDVEVVMTTPKPMTLPVAGPDASRYVADHLEDRGIRLLTEHAVSDIDAGARTLQFGNGSRVTYDVLLGVGADVAPTVVTDSPLSGRDGWIWPDPHTLATGYERVYAVGDCTTVPTATGQLPKAGVFAAGQAVVAARNIVADLGLGEPDTFDGHGYCFLELPHEQVAFVEGDFYADPPAVALSTADHEQFLRKQAYEREHLERWLG